MRFFINGQLIGEPKVSVLDEGLLYGYGVYETLRVYCGVVFRQVEHVRRLRQSAEKIGIDAPSSKEIGDAIFETVKANGLRNAALRVVLTAGSQSDWGAAEPSLLVLAKLLSPVKPCFKAICVNFHRDVASAKTLNCLTSVLARRQAQAVGVDEALFTTGCNILEGTASNVFSLSGGLLTTPKDGVLAGVTRNAVIAIAKDLGLSVYEGPLSYDALLKSDVSFVTGTLKEIVPLCELDGKTLRQGPVVAKIQSAFSELVRQEVGERSGV